MPFKPKNNIHASDYRFEDKCNYYLGKNTNNRKQTKEGTDIKELVDLANTKEDFTEEDIEKRHEQIISSFIEYMNDNELLGSE